MVSRASVIGRRRMSHIYTKLRRVWILGGEEEWHGGSDRKFNDRRPGVADAKGAHAVTAQVKADAIVPTRRRNSGGSMR
jgi:hypothetical protein